MFTLENQFLRVSISPRGAELCSLINRENNLEYIWQADPLYWPRHSPVLFPIVGALKDNKYFYNGREYVMSRHGFARDREFEPDLQSREELVFLLKSDEKSRLQYPFDFEFRIRYAIDGHRLSVTYMVTNPGGDNLLFSVGGHPAFRVPLEAGLQYEDYHLAFDESETADRWPIEEGGLIGLHTIPLLEGKQPLPVARALFARDALVFKNLQSSSVLLASGKGRHGLRFHFGEFPYLGIWAAPGADFVCIEPWQGIADPVNSSQQLEEKEGIVKLSSSEGFSRQWSVDIF